MLNQKSHLSKNRKLVTPAAPLDVSLSPCVTAGPNSGVTELRSAIRCNSSRPTDRSARAGTAKKPLTRTPYMAINNHLPIDRVLNQPPPNRGRSAHPSIIHPAAGWLAFDQHAARRPCAPGTPGRSPSLTGNPPSRGHFNALLVRQRGAPRRRRQAVPIVLIGRRGRNHACVRRCSCHAATQPRARGLPTKATAFLPRRAACHRNGRSNTGIHEIQIRLTSYALLPDETLKCFYFLLGA